MSPFFLLSPDFWFNKALNTLVKTPKSFSDTNKDECFHQWSLVVWWEASVSSLMKFLLGCKAGKPSCCGDVEKWKQRANFYLCCSFTLKCGFEQTRGCLAGCLVNSNVSLPVKGREIRYPGNWFPVSHVHIHHSRSFRKADVPCKVWRKSPNTAARYESANQKFPISTGICFLMPDNER